MAQIRVWKLGSLEHKIAPTIEAATKLRDILLSRENGKSMDLIWGPDLEIETHPVSGDGDVEVIVIPENMIDEFLKQSKTRKDK